MYGADLSPVDYSAPEYQEGDGDMPHLDEGGMRAGDGYMDGVAAAPVDYTGPEFMDGGRYGV